MYKIKPRICKKCNDEYTPNAGGQKYCLVCRVTIRKEDMKRADKKYKQSHREAWKKYKRKSWHELTTEQKEVWYAKKRKKYWENPELSREKERAKYKKWVSTKTGKFLHNNKNHKRREKEKLVTHSFTYDEWQDKLNKTKGVCPKCYRFVGIENLTLDHIIPIDKVMVGYNYTIYDVQPLCGSCNKAKCNK